MQLCRFHIPGKGPRLGQLIDGMVYDVSASELDHFATLADLLQVSVTTPIQALLEDVDLEELPSIAYADLDREPAREVPHLLPPVDRQEVWAAGSTRPE